MLFSRPDMGQSANPSEFQKSQQLIQIDNQLSHLARRVWNILTWYAVQLGGVGNQWFEIRLQDLARKLGAQGTDDMHTTSVRRAIDELRNKDLVFLKFAGENILERKSQTKYLGDVEWIPRSGVLRYSYGKLWEDIVSNGHYGLIDISILDRFTSKLGSSLYEQAALAVLRPLPPVPLKGLIRLLGAGTKYEDNFKDLNRYVLKPALDEVNKVSPFRVELIPHKTGRKITAMTIIAKLNEDVPEPDQPIPLAQTPEIISKIEESDLYVVMTTEFGVHQKPALQLLTIYPEEMHRERFENAFRSVREAKQKGEIGNLAGFTYTAIKNGYVPNQLVSADRLPDKASPIAKKKRQEEQQREDAQRQQRNADKQRSVQIKSHLEATLPSKELSDIWLNFLQFQASAPNPVSRMFKPDSLRLDHALFQSWLKITYPALLPPTVS